MKTIKRYKPTELFNACCCAEECKVTNEQLYTVEKDLMSLYSKVMGRLNIVINWVKEDEFPGYDSAKKMREDFFQGTIYAIKFHHPIISNFTYSRYRLLHDILNHCLGGLSFGYEDEYSSFEQFAQALKANKADKLTIAFCRWDILYKNAYYHACENGCVPEVMTNKLILKAPEELHIVTEFD